MKIKDGFILKKMRGIDGVVVPVGFRDYGGMATLNETGILLWEAMEKGADTAEKLVAALTAEYDVDEAAALRDVDAFLQNARSAGLIED